MFVMSGDRKSIVNINRYDRVEVNNPGENWLVSAYTESAHPKTLGRYHQREVAETEMYRLCDAIRKGENVYEMAENGFDLPREKVMDSRVRRRGGS